jgi:hypothetical protein
MIVMGWPRIACALFDIPMVGLDKQENFDQVGQQLLHGWE